MTYYEPKNLDIDGMNSTCRAFYEATQAYADLAIPGMNIIEDQSQPWLLDQLSHSEAVCPVGHICVPAGDSRNYFVRDTLDNKVYFSELGYQRYSEGADIDWAGVLRDLVNILGGSLGAGGLISAIGQMLFVADWGISYFHDNPPPR